MQGRFRIKSVAPQRLMVARLLVEPRAFGAALRDAFEQVWAYLNHQPSVTVGAPIARYLAIEDERIELEAGFPVAEELAGNGPVYAAVLPEGRAATTMHHGSYERLPEAHAGLRAWMAAEGYRAVGLPYEVYWVEPGSGADAPAPGAEAQTEIVWPIA
jgi:effector-binding domain-containing protein